MSESLADFVRGQIKAEMARRDLTNGPRGWASATCGSPVGLAARSRSRSQSWSRLPMRSACRSRSSWSVRHDRSTASLGMARQGGAMRGGARPGRARRGLAGAPLKAAPFLRNEATNHKEYR
jgi:hypothetical protein